MDGRNWYKNSNNSGSSYKSLESARPLIIILVHSWSQIDLENLITGLTAFSAKRKQKIVIFVIFLVEGPVSGRSREVFQPWNFPKSCIFFSGYSPDKSHDVKVWVSNQHFCGFFFFFHQTMKDKSRIARYTTTNMKNFLLSAL